RAEVERGARPGTRRNSASSIRRKARRCTGPCRCRRTSKLTSRSCAAMSLEIKWNDTDPETGERRFLRADKFAGTWRFCYRKQRRDVQWRPLQPTRLMWEHILDSLKR